MKAAWIILAGLLASSQKGPQTTLVDIRQAPFEPKLDGTLTNVAWRDATVFAKGFYRVNLPSPAGARNRRPTERTALYLMYDKTTVFVGLRMDDDHPDLIRPMSQTPNEQGDWAYVELGRGLGRTHYRFIMDPAGSQQSMTYDDAGKPTLGVPASWKAVIKRNPAGWIAELAIPFAALNGTPNNGAVWTVLVGRGFARSGEKDSGPYGIPASPNADPELQKIEFRAL